MVTCVRLCPIAVYWREGRELVVEILGQTGKDHPGVPVLRWSLQPPPHPGQHKNFSNAHTEFTMLKTQTSTFLCFTVAHLTWSLLEVLCTLPVSILMSWKFRNIFIEVAWQHDDISVSYAWVEVGGMDGRMTLYPPPRGRGSPYQNTTGKGQSKNKCMSFCTLNHFL